MKLVLVLCVLSLTWLQSCVIFKKNNTPQNEFENIWASALARLNQKTPDKNLLEDDLRAAYSDELKSIAKLWAQNSENQSTKNIFFHEHLLRANRQTFARAFFDTTNYKNSRQLAQDILNQVETHATASNKNVGAYDGGEEIGFCFGRALLIHYLLLQAKVSQNDIKKIFALGNFRVGSQFWRFHVAVMIKSSEGYIVIDPLYGEPALLQDWCDNIARLDVKQPLSRARFYISDPRKFMPSTASYSSDLLSPPELKPYFLDLGRSLKHITK